MWCCARKPDIPHNRSPQCHAGVVQGQEGDANCIMSAVNYVYSEMKLVLDWLRFYFSFLFSLLHQRFIWISFGFGAVFFSLASATDRSTRFSSFVPSSEAQAPKWHYLSKQNVKHDDDDGSVAFIWLWVQKLLFRSSGRPRKNNPESERARTREKTEEKSCEL